MEALAIAPAKASHQPAMPAASSGLGDLFQVLLRESALRLEAQAAVLPSPSVHRHAAAAPRASARELPSPIALERDDPARDHDAVSGRAAVGPDTDSRPVEPDGDRDAAVVATAEPKDTTEPPAADHAPKTGTDSEARPADDVPRDTEGRTAREAGAPEAGNPSEAGVAAARPAAAREGAAEIAAAKAQALGKGEFAIQAAARMAAQARAATAAASAAPATLGPGGAGARVEVTPAVLVASPNAALGGGAATAAMAASAGQVPGIEAGQSGQAGTTGQPNPAEASGQANSPGAALGLQNPSPAAGRANGAGAALSAQAPATEAQGGQAAVQAQNSQVQNVQGQNAQGQDASGGGAPATHTAAEVARASETQGRSALDTEPAPHNAQTPSPPSRNSHARNADAPGASPSGAQSPDARSQNAPAQNALAQNALAQNALAQTARSDNAQTEVALSRNAPVPNAQSQEAPTTPGTAQAQTTESQSTQQVPSDAAQNASARGAVTGEGSAPAAQTGEAGGTGSPDTTVRAIDRAAPAASAQRAEASGQQNANFPGAAGAGLSQAAARISAMLPAQARPAAAQPVPLDQVAIHIQKAVGAGADRIRIRLHPAELGQIDVKLNVASDGLVKVIVSVDKPETFELLQRDARGLEKALQDAGLKTDSGSLNFNLRGEGGHDLNARREGPDLGQSAALREPVADSPEDTPAAPAPVMSEHVLDMRV